MRSLLMILGLLVGSLAFGQVVALEVGALVDPVQGTTAKNRLILVDGRRIKSISPLEGSRAPEGAIVVNLRAWTVSPGMFDCHTHVCMRIDSEQFGRDALSRYDVATTGPRRALDAVANCREFLMAGITTIRDVGNSGNYVDTDVRRAIEEGVIEGPTIVNAGRIIAPFGGQYFAHPERRTLLEPEYFAADTRDEMTKAVRENIHFGARVIKIVVDDQRYIYSEADIRHIVNEAAGAGAKVCAHALTERGARNAILGGVASIEHGFSMSDEVLRLAKGAGVALVSTDLTPRVWKEYQLPDAVGTSIYKQVIDRLKRAFAAGVKLAFGSDLVFNIPEMNRGEWALSQIDGYVLAGIPNVETLRALTVNAAALCGLERERGQLRAGYFADIIATDADPLVDIQALRRVKFVMKDGRIVRNDTGKP